MPSPIIKWIGGKRQILNELREYIPHQYGRYYEPFIGGGAVFFDQMPSKATINDFNPQLIGMYQCVKASPEEVMNYLDMLANQYNSLPNDTEKTAYYYELRDQYNAAISSNAFNSKTAALLIVLNKAGFNGLYRVNRNGLYNVPAGHREQIHPYDRENFLAISKQLKRATILCGDFEKACKRAISGDFVFFDSPYFDTFDIYQAGGFTVEDHQRLAKLFDYLTDKGVACVLTNSNTDFIKELYGDYEIKIIPVKRMVNRDASHRTGTEIIVSNRNRIGGDYKC